MHRQFQRDSILSAVCAVMCVSPRIILRRCHCHSDLFTSTKQAFIHLKKEWNVACGLDSHLQYDIALISWDMEEMKGEEILSRMKNDLHLFLIPVIVLSASRDQTLIESCLLHGAAEFLYHFAFCFTVASNPSRSRSSDCAFSASSKKTRFTEPSITTRWPCCPPPPSSRTRALLRARSPRPRR